VEGLAVKRILGLLGWLGVVLVLAAVLIRVTRPEWQEWSRALALGGLVVTAIYALSQWRDIGRSFQGRNVRYGSIAAGSVLVFLGILVAVNYIGSRQHKRWDLTAAKQFSLSDQTKKILTDLKKPLVIHAFYGENVPLQSMRDALSEYQYTSKQVTVDYLDAAKDPAAAKRYDVQSYGTVVLEYNGRTEKSAQTGEQDVTNALKKVIEGKVKKMYFVQGHGEHDPTDSDRRAGYNGFAEALKSDNFEVAKLPLAQDPKVPDDATVVVIAGVKTDYLPQELDVLRAYLKKGGKLWLMFDGPEKADSPPLTNLIGFAKEWGVTVGQDVVLDQQAVQSPFIPVVVTYPSHPITSEMQRVMTAFQFTRSITPIEGGTDGHVPQKILETSPRSWAETDLKSLFADKQPELNADKGDKAGPITIGAAVSAAVADAAAAPDAPKPETRVVIIGDSDFVANSTLSFQGNRDLGLNIANWLAQQENLIAIRPHDAQDRRITLTEDQRVYTLWISLLIIPGLLLANGVRVWWKRR